MRLTLSWLKRHLITNATIDEITNTLTKIGLEVEEVVNNSQLYAPFTIAEIIETNPHPNADKLKICKVNDGNSIKQIVCGASNARGGIKVVLAPIGAVIPLNGMTIKAAKIRDIASEGMLCSAEELLLSKSSDGIIELTDNAKVGESFAEFSDLNDSVIDISLTPNRGDAACVHGVARDLAAAGLGELIQISAPKELVFKEIYPVVIEDKAQCQEFALTHIRNISNIDNEFKLNYVDEHLKAVGFNLKTPLINISNFAMFDFGRPNHIYDADKVLGPITIRKSYIDEKFIALGGVEYALPKDLLVVADSEKVLALAGVMGGELSKVDENTKNILVEVANFHPEAVSSSGRALNLLSESRYRFERRIDLGNTDFFISYLNQLLTEKLGGNIIGTVKVAGESIAYIKEIIIDLPRFSRSAGINFEQNYIHETLKKLGFDIKGNMANIPSYRYGDIAENYDLVEEVFRIYGLDNIPSESIPLSIADIKLKENKFLDLARNYLVCQGFNEMITYSFISEKLAKDFNSGKLIKLANPISADMSVMRSSHLPMLLENSVKNVAYSALDAQYFEIGNIYQGLLPNEQKSTISGLRTGKNQRKNSFKEERDFDFFDVKADIYALLKLYGINVDNVTLANNVPSYFHPGKSATLYLGKNLLGYIGEINPKILKNIGLEASCAAFELFVDNLPVRKEKIARSKLSLSYLQAISRDFAFELDDKVKVGELKKAITQTNPEFIEVVNIFDIYKGSNLASDKKSVALSVTIRPKKETFKEIEIENICQKIITLVQEEYGGIQR